MKTIGDKIKEARKAKGLTQEELAERSKINLRSIQRIENNRNLPRTKTVQLLCTILNLEIEKPGGALDGTKRRTLVEHMVNGFFLIVINLVLMSCIGYLTIDSKANFNSRIGAFLLSFFIPVFIVYKTKEWVALERVLKFGTGFFVYGILILSIVGFVEAFTSGVLQCLVVAMGVLFYGKAVITEGITTL